MSHLKLVSGVIVMALCASPLLAQEGPGDPPPPPPGQQQPPPRHDGDHRGMGEMMMHGDHHRMGPGMMRGGEHMPPEMMKFAMLRGYIDLVDHFSKLAHDPGASGVAAVVTAGDMLRARGADAAIDYFTKVLPDVKDPTIQRAIRIQLADLYKKAGQQDKALEQLRILMTGEGASANAPAK